ADQPGSAVRRDDQFGDGSGVTESGGGEGGENDGGDVRGRSDGSGDE
ncbi:hypothetical protein GRX66_15885, partial [Halobacterium sp. PCN9]|nr:hypothetical protein [Halobacterium bonnevillei]